MQDYIKTELSYSGPAGQAAVRRINELERTLRTTVDALEIANNLLQDRDYKRLERLAALAEARIVVPKPKSLEDKA